MENLNILSVGGFLFFLLILSIGYIMVEIIFGEYYPFRKQIKENKNSTLDRFIHYIIVGILSNIVFFFILSYTKSVYPFINIFNDSGKFGKSFSDIFGADILSFQLIWSALFYFSFFVIFLFVVRFGPILFVNQIVELIEIFDWNKKTKKIKKKK